LVRTTTNHIEFLDSGVVLSKMNTRSGFKRVYVIEQANSINHVLEGLKKPLLLDLSRIAKSSIDDVKSLITEETLSFSVAIGIVVQSNFKKLLLNTLLNFKGSKNRCPIQVFSSVDKAESWLEDYT
jgi:hypothetical protein